jgi:drug/metabolite transporter (DMT)-like permease
MQNRPTIPAALETPVARGSLVALAAAVLFGVTTPFVTALGRGVGPFATATLLYAGAALGARVRVRASAEPELGRRHLGRIALVAISGAFVAPSCLAWGLQHAGALAASLLLNLETVFTVLLAWALFREPMGRRVMVAVALMVAGGGVLATRAGAGGPSSLLGLAAIAAAALAWALDNTWTRPLADFDPRDVVFRKGLGGAALSAALALVMHDAWPAAGATAALLLCGAAGYGLSLRLYLRAQRTLGAARTASVFAVAPFVGAGLAFALGDRTGCRYIAAAGVLFSAAVYVHVTERHRHHHRHASLEHEHAHRHDDDHHSHPHDVPSAGEHSHVHRHEPTEHDHPHGSDLHHRHAHD